MPHDNLTTQQFGHQFLGVIMIVGDVVDDVAPDAFQCLLALLLQPFEFKIFFGLQQVFTGFLALVGSRYRWQRSVTHGILGHHVTQALSELLPLPCHTRRLNACVILGCRLGGSAKHRRILRVVISKVGFINHDVTIARVGDAHQFIGKAAYGLKPPARAIHAV